MVMRTINTFLSIKVAVFAILFFVIRYLLIHITMIRPFENTRVNTINKDCLNRFRCPVYIFNR